MWVSAVKVAQKTPEMQLKVHPPEPEYCNQNCNVIILLLFCVPFPPALLFLPKSHGKFSKFALCEEAANKAASVQHSSRCCRYCARIRAAQKALIFPVCSLTCQVFKPRTPPEAIALCSRLLEYTPVTRLSPLEACAHAFFDELRQPNTRLPSGRELPLLFNFSPVGQFSSFQTLIRSNAPIVGPLVAFALTSVRLFSSRAVYSASVELHTHSSSCSCADIACLTRLVSEHGPDGFAIVVLSLMNVQTSVCAFSTTEGSVSDSSAQSSSAPGSISNSA